MIEPGGNSSYSSGHGVLASQRPTVKRVRRDNTCARSAESIDHVGVLNGRPSDQAVGQLGRTRRWHAFLGSDSRRHHYLARRPVEDTPSSQLAGGDQRTDVANHLFDLLTVTRLLRVREIQVIHAHSLQRSIELRFSALLRPELPPEFVGEHDL